MKQAEWNEMVACLHKYFEDTGKSIVLVPREKEMIVRDLLKQPLLWLAGQSKKQREKVLNCMVAKRNKEEYQPRNQVKNSIKIKYSLGGEKVKIYL